MNQHINSQSHVDGAGYPESNYGYPSQAYMQDEKPFNWRKYVFLYLSKWYWFFIAISLALGVAFFITRYSIPNYQATATIILEEGDNSNDVMSEIRSIRYFRRRVDMANENAKLSSFSLAKLTVDSLISQEIFWTAYGRIRERHLYNNPRLKFTNLSDSLSWYKDQKWFIEIIEGEKFRFYKDEFIDTLLQYNKEQNINNWRFIIEKTPIGTGHNTYSFVVNDRVTLAKTYKNKIQLETDEQQGTIITLRSIGPVGEREVDYLNALCESFINSGLERKQQMAENTFLFIDEQILTILDSLQKSENQLLTFRLSNNVINLSKEGEMAFERLKGFHESKTELKLKANYYNYLKKYVTERTDPQTIISPTLSDEKDQLLIDAVRQLQMLYEERENLDFSTYKDNPGIESINARIQSYRVRILEIIDGLLINNSLILEQINTEEQAVTNQLKSLPVNEQQLLNIKRKYDLYNQFYNFLLQKRAEAGIQKASTISNARVLDAARYDQIVPIGNNKSLIILIAFLIGLLAPAVVLYLRNVFDAKIREKEDITSNTNIPIIGIIGHLKKGETHPINESPNSSFAESLRRIRSNLQFVLRDSDQKVIMITSSISGEGKTFTATNLATIIAMNNKKVLLVGCDMRRPALHKIFDIENNFGLSSIIIGENTIEESIVQSSIQNLFILPSGPIPPNPAELIETKEMKNLVLELKNNYDYIIFDTPPVALVSDSFSLAEYADIALYVVRQNYSHKDVIEIVNQLNSENRFSNISLIINDINPSSTFGYNYYYGYNGGYNYGYNYSKYSKEYYNPE